MGFYEQLSEHYDKIFSTEPGELDFIAESLGKPESLLDIGCGTGNKTELFKDRANSITAFDSDQTMIDLANSTHSAQNISYLAMDMRSISERFAPASFDAALCLGNTLVHITDPAAMSGTLAAIYGVLRKNGRLAVQILNYDRILDRKVTALPTLEVDGISFARSYSHNGELLGFDTELRVPGQPPLRNSVPLYPLRPAALEELLNQNGFKDVRLYGGFKGEALTGDSFVVIALAGK